MNFNKIKHLGKRLSNTELSNISGGISSHGTCNNGNHFTFLIREGMDWQQVFADIDMTICGGGGIDPNGIIFR